jgi:hypothetical protein
VSARNTAHRALYLGAKLPELPLHEIAARNIVCAETAFSAQHMHLHGHAFTAGAFKGAGESW